jgi:murein DD-endopeptidase MepM/ murein hydrolase activator NlpD
MAQLDSNIVLKAFATPQLDIVGTMRDAEDRKRQQMLQQRQDSEYAQQEAAQARQMQDMASERGVVQQYGTDPTGARQAAFQTGNAGLVAKLDSMDDAGRKRTIDVARGTAPLVLSLRKVSPEATGQAIQALAPELQARGWSQQHIMEVGQQLADPAQREAAFAAIESSAQTIEEYAAARKPQVVSAGAHLVTPDGQSLYDAPDKPNVQIVEGENGFYSVDKNTGRASPVSVGGASGGGAPAPAGGGYVPPPSNMIQTVTGGKGQVGSGFGPRAAPSPGASTFHNGVDVPLPAGTPVNSAADGTVIAAWNDTAHGGGQSVRIRHADGTVTGYADLGGYNVKVGQQVRAGQPIGTAGSSGSTSTGNHVHFSVRGPGGGSSTPSAPAMGGQLRGKAKAPAEGWRTMSPEEVAASGLPAGTVYQKGPKGEIKPVGGQQSVGGPIGTKQQQGLAKMKIAALKPIEGQLNRVETAMKDMEKNGYSGYFLGNIPGGLDAASGTFDKAVAGLAPLIRQLTRVPGEGSTSDYESKLATAALLSRTDTTEARKEAIAMMRELIANIRTANQEFLGSPAASGGGVIRYDAQGNRIP